MTANLDIKDDRMRNVAVFFRYDRKSRITCGTTKNLSCSRTKNTCSRLPVFPYMSKWFLSRTEVDDTSTHVELFVEKFSEHINARIMLMEHSKLFYNNHSIKHVLFEMCVDTLDLSHYGCICIYLALVNCPESYKDPCHALLTTTLPSEMFILKSNVNLKFVDFVISEEISVLIEKHAWMFFPNNFFWDIEIFCGQLHITRTSSYEYNTFERNVKRYWINQPINRSNHIQ